MEADIFKIIGIGLTGGILAITVKQYKPELAVLVSLATGVLLFFSVAGGLGDIWNAMKSVVQRCQIEEKYFTSVMKVAGIAYVTQFGAELCRDSGENAVASKIELAGKVFVLMLTMPIIQSFLDICIKALQSI